MLWLQRILPQRRRGGHAESTKEFCLKFFVNKTHYQILRELRYPEDIIRRVQELNLKKLFPQDPETRVLEDALCLVFLQFQLPELAPKITEEKAINALRKSWNKMTPAAQQLARTLDYGPREQALLQKALTPD